MSHVTSCLIPTNEIIFINVTCTLHDQAGSCITELVNFINISISN